MSFVMAIAVMHKETMMTLGMIPTRSRRIPKSGAPGSNIRTDGRAKSAVNVIPRRSVPESMKPRRIMMTSQVRMKMNRVEVLNKPVRKQYVLE